MAEHSYNSLRKIIIEAILPNLERAGLTSRDLDDTMDLLANAVIDSFDYLDMIFRLEEDTGIAIDLAGMGNEPIATVKGLIDSLLSQSA